MSVIHCRFITPHGIYKELDASIINIVTTDGHRGVLPNHVPIVAMLKISILTLVTNGERQEYTVSGGLFYFRNNNADILTDSIENKAEIDINRAKRAKERAERRLAKSDDPNVDYKRAEIALEKALNRLKITGSLMK